MNANEVRLGNYIFVYRAFGRSKKKNQIKKISINYISALIVNDYNYIHPIPLTEEWLVKFGAEKVNEISEYFDGEDMYSYELYLDGAECLFDRKCNCQPYEHIKYVHQLQNLYFALTGEELKQNVTENV